MSEKPRTTYVFSGLNNRLRVIVALVISFLIIFISLEAQPQEIEEQKLLASDASALSNFGYAVDIDGDLAVVGAPYDSDYSGAAYVFVRNPTTGEWAQQAKITGTAGWPGSENFGSSVALEANTLVIGAFFSWNPDQGYRSGSAYVYALSGGSWVNVTQLFPPNGILNFGSSVDISGDSIIIGAPTGYLEPYLDGSTHVFARSGSGWNLQATLLPSSADSPQSFGSAVAIDGDRALIGDFRESVENIVHGAAYVFDRDSETGLWSQTARIVSPDNQVRHFGFALDLEGDTAVIGDPWYFASTGTLVSTGIAYVFERSNAIWELQATLEHDDTLHVGDRFGNAVDLEGNTVVIGRPQNPQLGGPGKVHVFIRTLDVWIQQETLTPSDGLYGDAFGYSVAFDGSTALIGARYKTGGTGAAYVYDVNQPPTAEAGDAQAVQIGQTVYLDGSGSYDAETASESLLYAWTFDDLPAGSLAILSNSETASPSFVVDQLGDYIVGLVVTDEGGLQSAPDTVTVSSLNAPPNADAGPDLSTYIGDIVTLDGSGSSDPDGHALSYFWMLISPDDSNSALDDAGAVQSHFIPDIPGMYTAELIVNDGYVDSQPDWIDVLVSTVGDYASGEIGDSVVSVSELPISGVTNTGNQTALEQLLKLAWKQVSDERIGQAIRTLKQALEQTDGCILRGEPDIGHEPGSPVPPYARDTVLDCVEQVMIYNQILSAIEALES
jgi:hypothetical protein